jgi:maltooligosyltrehalose trehalohydrolase
MGTFVPRVWAPTAARVDLVLDGGETRPLEREVGGWFGGPSDRPLAHGTRYRYAVDGGPPMPDPRAAAQPDGVDGPSAVVDHEKFDWAGDERAWCGPASLVDAVFYELHVGTFTAGGTFAAAIDRLDHLVALGVTHVELLPVATFAGRYGWGYDGVHLYAPHPAYGPPDDLRRLVAACHRRGLGVVLDVVYNHLGPVGNVLHEYGPYFTDRHQTPWGPAVNLDGPGSDEVRRFLIDNALQWLREYRFDGLRLDAVHALLDTTAYQFLEELSDAVRALAVESGRSLVLIAESDRNDPRLVRSSTIGGLGLDAHWCDDVHHVLHAALTGESRGYYRDYDGSMHAIADALTHGYVFRGRYSPSRDLSVGRPPIGLRGRNLVVALQNHDQVGNRAGGERLHQLVDLGRVKAAAALVLLGPAIPLLFQGEEWAASSPFPYFADHDDPRLADAVRRGRRAEFAALGWSEADVLDPEARSTFERAKLDWEEVEREPHASTLSFYRELLALRREVIAELGPDGDALALTGAGTAPAVVAVDESRQVVEMQRGRVTVRSELGSGRVTVEP